MSDFQRVTAPGLPTWPSLMFDNQQQRAVVSFRVATWRSCEQARILSTTLAWGVMLFVGWQMWQRLAFVDQPILRGLLTLLIASFARAFAQRFVPAALDEFLARRAFSRRSTVWFTPEAIAFRSRMYENGVVVSRTWQGHPVQVKFDVAPDPEAVAKQSWPSGKHGHAPGLQSARVLRLVVAAFDPQRSLSRSTQSPLARAIPMLPLDLQDAQRLTVVLAAAAELTAAIPASVPTAQPVPSLDAGLDIDANPT